MNEKQHGTAGTPNVTQDTLPAGIGQMLPESAPTTNSGEQRTLNASEPSAMPVNLTLSSEDSSAHIEQGASTSMNLLNQSARSMLGIIGTRDIAPAERVSAARALASAMQVQVNMVKALTDVIKIGRK